MKALAILAVFAAAIGMVALVIFGSYVNAYNAGNQMEKAIQAQWEQNKNVLAKHEKRVLEAAQVPEMYRDDYAKMIREAMQGRYGEGGSKAVFQWIKEQNIKFDSRLYAKLQDLIEAGRNEFENEQKKLIDLKRGYETQLGYFWRGMWLKVAGYPKINLADYRIVTSERTEQVFEKGKEEPLRLRK